MAQQILSHGELDALDAVRDPGHMAGAIRQYVRRFASRPGPWQKPEHTGLVLPITHAAATSSARPRMRRGSTSTPYTAILSPPPRIRRRRSSATWCSCASKYGRTNGLSSPRGDRSPVRWMVGPATYSQEYG